MNGLVNQYLREMGIEVWVLREQRPSAPVSRATAPSRQPQPEPEINTVEQITERQGYPAEVVAEVVGQKVPRFHFCFMHGEGVSLVYGLALDADPATHPSRRFAGDLLLALTGKPGQSMTPQRWPIVQSGLIDQTAAAAKVVLKQRIDQCGPLLLVFGDEASVWVEDTGDRQRIDLPELGRYLDEPLTKRDLWQVLRRAMAGLNR